MQQVGFLGEQWLLNPGDYPNILGDYVIIQVAGESRSKPTSFSNGMMLQGVKAPRSHPMHGMRTLK